MNCPNRTNAEQKLIAGKISEDDYLGQNIYLYVYGGLVAMVLGFNLLRALGWFSYSYLISVNMHNKMFQSVVRAPTKFFDDNPPGKAKLHNRTVGSSLELGCLLYRPSNEPIYQGFGTSR